MRQIKSWLGKRSSSRRDLALELEAINTDIANTEERVPCVLLVDFSASMRPVIAEVQSAIADFIAGCIEDEVLSKVLDIAVVSCSGKRANLLLPFSRPQDIELPSFVAGGETPLHEGILLATNEIEQYRERLAMQGIDAKPPMVVVITDGNPSDHQHKLAAIAAISRYEAQAVRGNKIGYFFFATTGGNIEGLQKLSQRPVKQVATGAIRGITRWILASVHVVSTSVSSQQIRLPNPDEFTQF